VASFHTRLDAVAGGVNDTLAALLGLCECQPFGNEGEEIGRIGHIDGVSLSELCERVKAVTGAPFVLCADGGKAPSRVAILGGEGGDDVGAAARAGADTYISGRIGYHHMVDAAGRGLSLIEAGHFYTEFPVCATLKSRLSEIDPSIKTEIFDSNTIGWR
jgi:putative NIF3 family GTP cyclohydrolase 1 type 2